MFYIWSIKWTRGDTIVWWRPENSGYTIFMGAAGKYTLEEIEAKRWYYDNGESTKAIPCAVADGLVQQTVPNDSHALGLLKECVAELGKLARDS